MDERRLRKLFHFTEDDLPANRRGQFSELQMKRLRQEAKAEQASARSSAGILFVIAAAGLAVGLTIGSIAPTLSGRILVLLLMGFIWPLVWAGRGVRIILSARALQEPHLREVRGRVHIIRHTDPDGSSEYVLQVGDLQFDVDGNPTGALAEGEECVVYYLKQTEEVLSVEVISNP